MVNCSVDALLVFSFLSLDNEGCAFLLSFTARLEKGNDLGFFFRAEALSPAVPFISFELRCGIRTKMIAYASSCTIRLHNLVCALSALY